MKPLEIEVKFYLTDPDAVRTRILSLGAAPRQDGFETNVRFDDAGQRLMREKKMLRLRQDTRCRLTVKSPPADADENYKIFREDEVEVGDFQTMIAILEQLGFYPRQIYEKRRETFSLLQTELCLDTLPFGHFLEIEGEKEAIRTVAEAIGLPWEKRITANYLSLFAMIKKEMDLPFDDVTFVNFEKADPSRIQGILESGRLPPS